MKVVDKNVFVPATQPFNINRVDNAMSPAVIGRAPT